MTAIAGLVQGGRVYIGGDSAGVAGYSLTVRADEKVFQRGEYLFGFTSSFRMGQLLRYRLQPPTPYEWERDMVAFMSTRFVDEVRRCLKEYGYAKVDDSRESGGAFLVGFRGALYMIEDDYQVGVPADPYAAVGCGADLVQGALHATTSRIADPIERIACALAAAERFSAGVRRPFVVKATP